MRDKRKREKATRKNVLVVRRWVDRLPLWVKIVGIASIIPAIIFWYYACWALMFDLKKVSRMPATSFIYDCNGYVIQRIYDEHRLLVNATEIPMHLKQALIATEDRHFLWHFGFDPTAILRAVLGNFRGGRIVSGASTITQQLARNSADMSERTIDRKIKEIFLAMRIEMAFTKDEILLYYLNRVYFGRNIYGIGAAAEAYFGKRPSELTLEEAALLIGTIAAPNAYSPWKSPEKARGTRKKTLNRMREVGFITQEDADQAASEPIVLRPLREFPGSYAVEAIMKDLTELLPRDLIFRGGLNIRSTIDLTFQKTAELELEKGLQKVERSKRFPHISRAKWGEKRGADGGSGSPPYLQGAFVAIQNADGGVLAIVGGRNYEESPFNRALFGRRQIGSVVKPFVYAHAFNALNCSAFTRIDASPFDLKDPWNYYETSPQEGRKDVTIRRALETSDNYAAMRTGLYAGLKGFSYFMKSVCGATPPELPSSLLGAFEVAPLDMTSAFSVFPNYGVKIQPYIVESIRDNAGALIYKHPDKRARFLSPEIAFQINDLLQGVVEEGTARSLTSKWKVAGPIGGKTGTTNDYRDSWFVGYTSEITAGVWIGFDRPQSIMPSGYASRLAVPVWGRIMSLVNQQYRPKAFPPPPGIVQVQEMEKRGFWIFKKKYPIGRKEYVREDQVDGMLERVDQATLEDVGYNPDTGLYRKREKSWWDKIKAWFGWGRSDRFEVVKPSTPEGRAIIQNTDTTQAPKAREVDSAKKE